MDAKKTTEPRPVILFDGVCNLCNGVVDFVIRRDTARRFLFAPLQSETGQALLRAHDLPGDDLHTVVLVEGDAVYTRSTAALRLARQLGGLWPLLYVFALLPRTVRDGVYDGLARRRYRWFGRRDTCRVPHAEEVDRFLS